MLIFKCKMCGGTIEFNPGDSVGVCDSCGTKQTLPRLDDDRRANLYDRANHFRRNNEFDKAAGIYETILSEDATDAEAYWSIVLCRYGIEYVEDPATKKRVPTVNRAQFTSIFDDADYKSAIQYADVFQRAIFEQEAAAINEIQKGILAISQKETPFDVFICYKETDSNGRRTPDSVLANDLYYQLTQEGFKVFFSRITLEDKLGTAYEPYIFAALNSSKVMVVLGTRPEYFNAVWVKNEWSRYLSIVKKSGGKKVLIPAYRDMDPYDLPEEFSHLQALDMSKLGFMQDLIRGVKKIARTDEPKETFVTGNAANGAPLLRRAFMFLEDGEWDRADDFCEQVLNQEPENAQAYLGKLMAELRVRRLEDLSNCAQPFNNNNNYQRAVRFGDDKFAEILSGYIDHINERNKNASLTDIYENAVTAMKSASSESLYREAAEKFRTVSGFKNADSLVEQCLERAEICRKDAVYDSAKAQMADNSCGGYEAAIKMFSTILGWKDADEQVGVCSKKIEEFKVQEEAERLESKRKEEERCNRAQIAARKHKKIAAFVIPIAIVCIAFVIALTKVIIPNSKYNSAVELFNSGKYDEAISAFTALNGYKDSETQLEKCYIIKKYGEEKYNFIESIKVGDTYKFGSYEQNNESLDGKEEIEWKKKKKNGTSLFLISKYALDCLQFNKATDISVTWDICSLRKWLNETFVSNAFSTEEQKMIHNSTIIAEGNPSYRTSSGRNTMDKVFLLSITEVTKYFGTDNARQCQGTPYCYAQNASKSSNGNCGWWLRTTGYTYHHATYVRGDGAVNDRGLTVDYKATAVRPALWIDLGVGGS